MQVSRIILRARWLLRTTKSLPASTKKKGRIKEREKEDLAEG